MTTTTCHYCGRPKALDAFSGEGGAGRGYHRAGFCVDAVDNVQARLNRYPLFGCQGQTRVLGDAVSYIANHGHRYALCHASPPCTGYSRGTAAIPDRLDRYDRLIAVTREALVLAGVPYVIENVEDARSELRDPVTLCWTQFHGPGSVVDEDGTPLWMKRHRVFESNLPLEAPGACHHPRGMQCAGVYGGARSDKHEARTVRKGGYTPKSRRVMEELLGVTGLTVKGMQLSIPPVYAEHVGRQVLAQLG